MVFLLLVIIIIISINFFRRVFSECTEANATSLIPLDTILPEICAFIIGFSCTVWTKMRSLADSLADGVLADAWLASLNSIWWLHPLFNLYCVHSRLLG